MQVMAHTQTHKPYVLGACVILYAKKLGWESVKSGERFMNPFDIFTPESDLWEEGYLLGKEAFWNSKLLAA